MKSRHIFAVLSACALFQSASADQPSAAMTFFNATQAKNNFEHGVILGLKNSLSGGTHSTTFAPLAKQLADKYFPWQPLKEQYLATMTAALTPQDIEQATKFYQSPTGQKLVSIKPKLNTISVDYIQRSLHTHSDDIEHAINTMQFTTLRKQAASKKASSLTQATLGEAYLKGIGTKPSAKKALPWFKKAAKAGNPMAQAELAKMYDNGIGLRTNKTRAVIWYHKAASQGDANAMYQIAKHFAHGTGVPKDAKKSAKWYQDAAMRSNICGKYLTGMNYLNGTGFKKDPAQAKAWLSAFAEVAYFTLDPESKLKKIYDISNAYAAYKVGDKQEKITPQQQQAIALLQKNAQKICA